MTQDKRKLLDYLKTQHLMSLATQGNKIWSATVYYAVDDDFNFYFVTGPKTEHGLNIAKNPEVAVTIFDSHQPNSGDKIGVQMRGRAELVSGVNGLRKAIDLWNKINPGAEKWINLKNIQAKAVSSRAYVIKPEKIKFFSTGGDDEHEQIFNF